MDIIRWKSQLLKGAAELAVLAILEDSQQSGIGLLERTEQYPLISLSDGTIYPLLKRLEREGYVIGKWVVSADGKRPTKQYKLTRSGKQALASMREAWIGFRNDLSDIVETE